MRLQAERYLTDSATWTRGGSRDKYGRTTSGAASTSISVRWLHEVELIRGKDGREVVSSAQVSTDEAIEVGDLITDEGGSEYEVLAVRTAQDVRGAFSHYVARVR